MKGYLILAIGYVQHKLGLSYKCSVKYNNKMAETRR